MRYFDLHCDTLFECVKQKCSLKENSLAIDLKRGGVFSDWVQTYGFWIPDTYRGQDAYDCFLRQYTLFQDFLQTIEELDLYPKGGKGKGQCSALLAVEGGAALHGDLRVIWDLKKKGIRLLTLTWNGENEIASGALSRGGLTSFGEKAVAELEKAAIVIDVSHLNEESFWDVYKKAKRPLIATHSNAHSVCPHPRNLKDDQIRAILETDGLIGLNFFGEFLYDQKEKNTYRMIARHIDYFLKLGCESHLAIGSDFDGAVMPEGLEGIEKIPAFYQYIEMQYGKRIAEKLFFENADRFFKKQEK